VIADINFTQGLQDAWERIAVFVPKFVAFLLILVIGYFIAKLLARILNGVLERVGFDGWVERGGIKQALAKTRYDASDILAKIVFWAIFLFVLQLAFGVFGPNPISDLIHGVIAYLPNIFVAIVILVIAGVLAQAAADLLRPLLAAVTGGEWMATGASVAIWTIGFFAALSQLKIAPAIVNGLFFAILAIVVGSAVISIGVGGIPVARRYLEKLVGRGEQTGTQVTQELRRQRPTETGPSMVDLTEEEEARRRR
jgi:Mechanosensitive ion channel, conserved TM helix